MIFRRPVATRVQIGGDGASDGGIDWYFALIKSLGAGHSDRSGAFMDSQIFHFDIGRLADTETGLHHELDEGIISFTQAMWGLPGDSEKSVELLVSQPLW